LVAFSHSEGRKGCFWPRILRTTDATHVHCYAVQIKPKAEHQLATPHSIYHSVSRARLCVKVMKKQWEIEDATVKSALRFMFSAVELPAVRISLFVGELFGSFAYVRVATCAVLGSAPCLWACVTLAVALPMQAWVCWLSLFEAHCSAVRATPRECTVCMGVVSHHKKAWTLSWLREPDAA
jgi:hypothetical protein